MPVEFHRRVFFGRDYEGNQLVSEDHFYECVFIDMLVSLVGTGTAKYCLSVNGFARAGGGKNIPAGNTHFIAAQAEHSGKAFPFKAASAQTFSMRDAIEQKVCGDPWQKTT